MVEGKVLKEKDRVGLRLGIWKFFVVVVGGIFGIRI